MSFKATMDSRAFDAALKRYLEFTKKSIPEIVNNKAYFVSRNAVLSTGAVKREEIEQELRATAKHYNAPLAAILVNARRGAKGEKGLAGAKMDAAVNKLLRARKRTANFLRAGWIPAVKGLAAKLGKSSSAKGVKQYGAPKGGVRIAKVSDIWRTTAEIWNSVTSGNPKPGIDSKHNPQRVADLIEDGLQKAIDKETSSMLAYIEKKTKEGLQKLRTA